MRDINGNTPKRKMINKIRLGGNAFAANRGKFLAVDAKDQEKAIGKNGTWDTLQRPLAVLAHGFLQ